MEAGASDDDSDDSVGDESTLLRLLLPVPLIVIRGSSNSRIQKVGGQGGIEPLAPLLPTFYITFLLILIEPVLHRGTALPYCSLLQPSPSPSLTAR